MDIKNRILQSIRRSKYGVLLRFELSGFGSDSQVTAALGALCNAETVVRIERGVYVLTSALMKFGKEIILKTAHQRKAAKLKRAAAMRGRRARSTATARYVSSLAKKQGIMYKATYSDHWAGAVTRLAGDKVIPDATDDLLVALTREGKLSADEMVKLMMDHHRALKSHV